ncbi:MAG: 4-hydroxy-tetrahydrodipicolinate reductase [Alphaproteobacteria bacterium]
MSGVLNIGIVGAGGRMGRMIAGLAAAMPGVAVTGAAEVKGSPHLGADLGTLAGLPANGVTVTDDSAAMFAAVDVVIDFTAPAATAAHAALAARQGCALVAGTTGLEPQHRSALAEAGKSVPVVWASNMSSGVNLLFALVEQVAKALPDDYDIEIVEMHHRHKVDAPSGTAITLGEAAARGRGVDLAQAADRGRDGITGARVRGHIGFAALRGGDVVGDHTVIFAGGGERIELTHKAASREVFARGALRAALWTQGRAPGLYSMKDVLGVGG